LAISDLKEVLESSHYPIQNRFKLLQRLSKAYEAIRNYPEAIATYKLLLKSLESSRLDQKQIQKLKIEAQTALDVCNKKHVVNGFVGIKNNLTEQENEWDIKTFHQVNAERW